MKNYFLALFYIVFSLFSCSINDKKSETTNTPDSLFVSPRITRIADLPDSLKPKTIVLSEMPEPQKIIVPAIGSNAKSYTTPDGRVLNIKPPVKQLLPAFDDREEDIIAIKEKSSFDTGKGGLPYYTSYTTDDGLAMNSVMCATMDKRGHIWFGTWGQGISRYDGIRFTNYSTENGLPAILISSILEDQKGNIWIGSSGQGIIRFDGSIFSQFSITEGLSDNNVSNIMESSTGKIWVITVKGIDIYDPDIDKIINLNSTNAELNNYTINCLEEDKTGNIWFGTNKGAICFEPLTNRIIKTYTTSNGLAGNFVYDIHKDKKGSIWIGTNSGLSCLNSINKEKITNYNTNNGLAGSRLTAILEDSKGKLWFETNGNAVNCFEDDENNGSFNSFSFPLGRINLITIDSSDKLWIGTFRSGVICFNPSDNDGSGSFITFSTEQGLLNNYVTAFFESSTGDFWLGSLYLVHFDGTHVTNYTNEQGVSQTLFNFITEDQTGKIWFGGWNLTGTCCYDPGINGIGGSFTTYNTTQGLPGSFVCSKVDHFGNVWFSSWENGVFRFDGKTFTNYNTNHGLGNNLIRSITEDKTGNIWFASAGGGLSCFNPSDKGVFTTFRTNHGIAADRVNSLTTDSKGNLWIATDNGLNFVDASTLEKMKDSMAVLTGSGKNTENLFKKFTTDNGLPTKSILNIVELRKGKMALGSNKGLTIFSYPVDSLESFNSLNEIETFNYQSGYPVREIATASNSMFVDSKGILWLATNSEKTPLVRFDYDALTKNNKIPSLLIQQIKISEEAISWQTLKNINKLENEDSTGFNSTNITDEITTYGKSLSKTERKNFIQKFDRIRFSAIRGFYSIPVDLEIPYKHNRITIDFGTNELIRPQLIEYQYILDGYDKDWSPALKKTSATFGNIKEGTYNFRVKARYTGPSVSGADNWTEPVNYTFKILPPWYRSWLAYIFYAILVLLAIWQVHRFQKERTLRIEREKAQKRELEHAKEIEKAYTNLKATQSQLIQSEKMASLGELTAGIAHEIQNPLNFVNNFSEVSIDLIDEMDEELANGNDKEVKAIKEDLKQNLQKISHHGNRASSIVKGMLQHSRTSTGHKELTEINALADEYLRLAYHGLRAKDKSFNADFKTEFDETLPKINVIPQDIGRVLLNLINNAFYAVQAHTAPPPPGGGIKERGTDYKPTVIVRTASWIPPTGGGGASISVSDNGPGIPDSIKDKIFQPFFTTKPTGSGTGLGLSLSYDIVKAHGGEIKVDSKEGEGTEFTILLPSST